MTIPLDARVEQIIDDSSLHDTLEAIVTVCINKAEHLRRKWQDEQSAKQYEAAAKTLNRVLNVAAIRNL